MTLARLARNSELETHEGTLSPWRGERDSDQSVLSGLLTIGAQYFFLIIQVDGSKKQRTSDGCDEPLQS